MKLVPALLLLLLAAPAMAQSGCSPADVWAESMLPLGLQNKLLAHKIAKDDFELEAAPDVSRDIVILRKTLDVATQAFFRCVARQDTQPATLQAKLSEFLHTDRSKRDDSKAEDGVYGANLTVHIEPAKGFPDSIFVVLTFGIECGDDNLLFLYTRENTGWTQRLHWYSDKYTQPSDAFGGPFTFETVHGPVAQAPLVAGLHGHPWCTSVHSEFTVDLLQPASASAAQRILDHLTHSYVINDEFTLTSTASGLQIRTTLESIDTSIIFHPGLLGYDTTTGKLIQLPVARNARDFVDEWLQQPWRTVASWSDSARVKQLQSIHDVHAFGEFGPVRGCSDSKNHFQVQLTRDDDEPIYAHVRQNPNSFTMLSIEDDPNRSCKGPDLMKKAIPSPAQ